MMYSIPASKSEVRKGSLLAFSTGTPLEFGFLTWRVSCTSLTLTSESKMAASQITSFESCRIYLLLAPLSYLRLIKLVFLTVLSVDMIFCIYKYRNNKRSKKQLTIPDMAGTGILTCCTGTSFPSLTSNFQCKWNAP